MQQIDILALTRMALIMLHIIALAASAAGIAFGDYSLFKRRGKIDYQLLHGSARVVTWGLVALWVTGLAIIWLDTHFVWNVIMSKPKIMAKLTVVTVLTLNGAALHWLAFPRLQSAHVDRNRAATLPALLGAVSAVTWMYAIFVGVGRAAAPLLGYTGFIALYVVGLITAGVVAMIVVRPRIAAQMRAAQRVDSTTTPAAQGARDPATRAI